MELPLELPTIDLGPSLYVDGPPLYPAQSPTSISDPFEQVDFGQMNLNSIAGMDMQDVSMDFNWVCLRQKLPLGLTLTNLKGFWGDPVDLDPVEYTV